MELPAAPIRATCPEGSGLEVCYDEDQAWALDQFLEALIETWMDARDCAAPAAEP